MKGLLPLKTIAKRRPHDPERGQASIMIGMLLMTLMLFFAFVVNTGMLVNAKINLQNAADLAAYSGAAVQARQLDHIAYLNYEMRRQYKKFLFRYYVMGNLAQATHPRTPGTGRRLWRPAPSDPTNFQVPSVCVRFNDNDNYCQVSKLQAISTNRLIFNDPISDALKKQLSALERIRRNNCVAISETNVQLLTYWLYNTDPELKNLDLKSPDPAVDSKIASIQGVIKGLAYGLGLVPREILLRQRIQTLASYVNLPAARNLSLANVEAIGNSGTLDVAARERVLQAFYSAYFTLGENTFAAETIRMDELLPTELLRFEPDFKVSFDTYAQMFLLSPAKDCESKLVPMKVVALPLAVIKDPNVLTYYAVRLKAKARILFSPFGDLELKSYAAAQPFGSRIGPRREDLADSMFHRVRPAPNLIAAENVAYQNQIFNSLLGQIPNLVIGKEARPAGGGWGWDTNFVLGSMHQTFSVPGATIPATLGINDYLRAYQAAMAPNLWESGRYTIPNDEGPDSFVRNFDTEQNLAFWAPIISPDQAGKSREILKTTLDEIYQVPPGGTALLPPAELAQFKDTLLQGFMGYLEKLRAQQGENSEGLNVARLEDPFRVRDLDLLGSGARGRMIQIPGIVMDDPKQIRTSWSRITKDSTYREEGRSGYSVKIIAFDSLLRNKTPSNGSDLWSNTIDADSEAFEDLKIVHH